MLIDGFEKSLDGDPRRFDPDAYEASRKTAHEDINR
jgi:hypothetical protein